ncbi:uncharacterized protein Pyn_12879 [Prunus yedoensis var. nudiflora]|uniref:Uncharacterized protein n=1 Tax=Prunus yedoensis var. nudiflora TaxID=2094558 RepID=A0A314XIW1_PRUYE|nr:uncharacterized protein Pyn_12879 [Prunus yedoensis var. nudiflora]
MGSESEREAVVLRRRGTLQKPGKVFPKVAASGPPSSKRMPPQCPCYGSNLWLSGSSSRLTGRQKLRLLAVLPKSEAKARKPPRFQGAGACVYFKHNLLALAEARAQTQDLITNGTDEDLDEDQYYNRDEGTYPGPDTHSEEPDTSDMPPGFASSHERRMNLEPVVLIAKDMVGRST